MHDIPSNYRNDKKTYFIDTELMNIKDYNNIVIREV